MGDATPDGPTKIHGAGADTLQLNEWGRQIAQTPNGVLVATFLDTGSGLIVYTSTDGGSTWSNAASVGSMTSNGDSKDINPCLAVDGNNRLAVARKPSSTQNTRVTIWDVNSDGTVANQTTHILSVSLDVASGNMALTATSVNEFWLCVHFSTATSSNYGFQLRRESPTDSSDPFGQVNAQFGQSNNDAHYADVQAGPNDKIHVSYFAAAATTSVYLVYDPANDVTDVHEDIGSNLTGATTLCFNELDEPVIAINGQKYIFHKNSGVWESHQYTTDSSDNGGVSSTYPNGGGDGDIGRVYLNQSDFMTRVAYGRLDNNQTGSAIRTSDVIADRGSITKLVAGYQYHHSAFSSSDEIDCLMQNEDSNGTPSIYYLSAPTPLTVNSSVEVASNMEPAMSTVATATASMNAGLSGTAEPSVALTRETPLNMSPSGTFAEEPTVSTQPGGLTRNVSVDSFERVERISAIVHASAAVVPESPDLSADEPSLSTSVGGVTQTMATGSLLTAEPASTLPSSAALEVSSGGAAALEPTLSTSVGGVTQTVLSESLQASESDVAFSPSVTLRPSSEASATLEPPLTTSTGKASIVLNPGTLVVSEPSVIFEGGEPAPPGVQHIIALTGEFLVTRDAMGLFGVVHTLDGEFVGSYALDGESFITRTFSGEFDVEDSVDGETKDED